MYLPSKIFCCCMLLFVVLSSESQGNSTKSDKQIKNWMVQVNLLESFMKYSNDKIKSTRCNLRKNSIKNDEMQYNPDINSTKSNRKNNNDSKRYESREYIRTDCERSKQMEFDANSTEINNLMLQETQYLFKTENEGDSKRGDSSYKDGNSYTDNNIKIIIVPNEECDNVSCIQFCCPFVDKLMMEGNCVEKGNGSFFFLPYEIANENASEHEMFYVTVRDPCVLQGHSLLDLEIYNFYGDGTIRDPNNTDKLILSTDYCFAILNRNIYDVIVCNETEENEENEKIDFHLYLNFTCVLVSLPFLLLTFVIYSILPELQNIHGYILRALVASLFIMYAMLIFLTISGILQVSLLRDDTFCILLVYIWNFSFLSTFFWLNVTCFDIWFAFSVTFLLNKEVNTMIADKMTNDAK